MALMDESVWRGAANLDAFTDTRWVTVRADIAPYPF
jgi:hypothetical protein